MKIRVERDSLGNVDVPADAYFGAQTQRATQNFMISGTLQNNQKPLIKALGMVKLAAVRANRALGDIDERRFAAIVAACEELIGGEFDDQFVVDVYQGGAGTSVNMNANEVIANRALEHLGFPKGSYDEIHPNNHVNLSQSTNDVYPTAIRLALLESSKDLVQALDDLAASFDRKATEFRRILKLGRTQLQDAVPMTLGQEFGAFATTLREDIARVRQASELMLEINLGGTAIGTGITADPRYSRRVVDELSSIADQPFVLSQNLIEACWDTGAFVLFSGVLKRTATKLSKISNDLRLLSSGPRGGLGEIELPHVQPGSSIMPGKVNPVIPEVVNQVAFRVIGSDLTVTMAAEAGQLQLNAMEPVIVQSLLESIGLLVSAMRTLRINCIEGIRANTDICEKHLMSGTALATALVPLLGYDVSAELAKQALRTGKPLSDLLREHASLSDEVLAQVFTLATLVAPSRLRPAAEIQF